jgi:hypothetical protein
VVVRAREPAQPDGGLPVRIIDGHLQGNFHCQMPFISGKGQFQAGEVFNLNISERQYSLPNMRPSRFTFPLNLAN